MSPTNLGTLRAVLADALDMTPDDLRDDDNLIALGLDSISIMGLAAEWRRAGTPVAFGELAAAPTLSAWHALLTGAEAEAAAEAGAGAAAGADVDESAPFPLALMQHAYWAGRTPGQRLGGVAAHFYHEFDGTDVDPVRLETAVRAVLAQHGMLRARILDDGTQRILPTSPWPGLRVHDLRRATERETRDELERIRASLSHRRLDIGAGEVFDVRLSLLPGRRTRMHVNLDMVAADALSLRVLLADLAGRYENGAGEERPPAYSYPRYLADRAAHRAGPGAAGLDADRAYWQQRLAELPGPPELPVAAHGADAATTVVRRHRVLDPERRAVLEERARQHGLTPAMALTAVFAETLTAWSAEPAFLLNLPLFDREPLHPDVDALVGDFTSSVLLAWDGAAPGTFAERAGRLQERFHTDAAHAGHSGVEVLRDLTRQRGEQTLAPVVHTSALGLGPLFPEAVRRCFGEAVWIISQGPQVWLDAQVTELDGGLLVNWDAREDAFAPGVLDAMFGAYGALLDRLLADDAGTAWTAPVPALLPDAQLGVRARVNDTGEAPAPGAGTRLHDPFFAAAAERPDAPALLWGEDGTLSHGELAARALAVAGHLRAHGVRPGDLVAVSLPKGPEQVVAVLGVLAAGAAYLPLGTDQPEARRRRILDAAGACLLLDDLTAPLAAAEPLPHPVATSADDLAYVLYTSGSTGEPKGVEVTHAAAAGTIADLAERFELGPESRTLALSALEFDLSVFDIFAPLGRGGAVVCVAEEDRRDATAWAALLRRHRATVLNCVPALLDMLLTVLEDAPLDAAPPLRAVLLGGDRVSTDLPRRLHALAPRCRCAGLGGTTETAIHSTVHEVAPGAVTDEWTSVPYGTPLRGVACRVVDPLGRDRPDRVPGELWIGGTGVARGYRGDPERTADRFVMYEGRRWYRTGDRARYHPDGTLEFLGRTDHQVKVRGHRVEPGEIEAALTESPSVAAAAVVLTSRGRLAAAVVPATGTGTGTGEGDEDDIDLDAVREEAARRLPGVMVPETFAVLGALPLTANGKVDRAALRTTLGERTAHDTGGTRTPPRTEAERLVAAAWRDVLGVEAPDRPGREDDFFALGGDSLLATRLFTRLHADGASGVALSALFAHPVLADFAETLRFDAGTGAAAALPAPPEPDPAHRHEPFPPTDVQLAYWLGRGEDFTLGGVGCHFYREYDVEGLDIGRLEHAVDQLVARHEMLRAVFDERGHQRILPVEEVPRFTVPVTEVADGADAEAAEAALAALRDRWSHHVFDPSRWPLFSVAAVRRGTGDRARTRLAIGMDNLVLDALSILTFYAELSALYAASTGDGGAAGAELPAPGLSFRDYVLGTAPDPAELAAAESYWSERLDTLPPPPGLPLATDPARVERPRFSRRTATLDAARWRALTERARAHGVTPSAVLLTAYCEILSRWSARNELAVNLTLFDRREVHPDIHRVFGDFTSLLLVGHHPEPGESWLARTRRVQRELWQALDHRAVSAVRVLRELSRRTGEADVTVPVVFTSALGMAAERDGGTGEDDGGLFADQVWGITQTPQVWLDHQVVERPGPDGMCVDLHWDAVDALFPPGLLDTMFDAYGQLLDQLASGDWTRPAPVPLPAAQRETRRRVNATGAAQHRTLLHDPFFRRAAEAPQAPAVISETDDGTARTLTYGELADSARRVAALLAAHGVASEEPVAVSLPKGPEQIAAVLGVLAAGAAYVPVGVDQPAVRRDRILTSGGVRLVLTGEDGARGRDGTGAETVGEWPGQVKRLPLTEAARHAPVQDLPSVDPDALAYTLFTSGSTGEPKGVEITHRAAANTVEDLCTRCGIGADDRVLAVSALDFDLSVHDIFGLLGAGGAVVTVAEHERRDPHRWAALARRHRVTVWNTVPTLMDMLLIVAESDPRSAPRGLRVALLSGDWVGLDLPGRLSAALPDCRLLALGGATEAAIWSNAYEVDRPDPGQGPDWRSVPYGYPLRNQRYRVADDWGRDCPDWVPGELWIGGTGLARGYRAAPELTARKFVTHEGERWYRTGDLGRYRPGGLLEFLGRSDDQVKVRGHRIELGEIEAALTAHPAVDRAAAAVTDRAGVRGLTAAVVATPAPTPPVTPETLRGWLSARLPAHMLPDHLAVLPELPLTSNGKLDRVQLAALAAHGDDAPAGAPPEGETETTLAALWSAVLETPVKSRDDSFFALGGDSVKALRFAEQATRTLGTDIPLSRFFAKPTIRGVSAYLRERQQAEEQTAAETEEGVI